MKSVLFRLKCFYLVVDVVLYVLFLLLAELCSVNVCVCVGNNKPMLQGMFRFLEKIEEKFCLRSTTPSSILTQGVTDFMDQNI